MKKIFEFLNKYATLLLVTVTVFYAVSSWSMVNIMKDEFEASNRPYVGIVSETHLRQGNELYFMPRIANPGNVSVEITSIETNIPGFIPLPGTIILLPRQERIPSVEIDKPNLSQDLFFVIEIEYRNLFNEQKIYCISYDYEIKGGTPERIYLKNSGYCDSKINNINNVNKIMALTFFNKIRQLSISDKIQLLIAVATFLAIILALGIEIFRKISEKINKNKRIKMILQSLDKEIEEGIVRCEALIGFAENEKISFSRIYNAIWDSAKLEILQNINNFEILKYLHKIYYRFDLINFNMEHDRFAVGAAFAKQYLNEIKENFNNFKNKIYEN